MSLFDVNDLVTVKLYYTFKSVDSGKKLVILEDDKAEELLKDEEKKGEVEVIDSKWRNLNWKEQNEVTEASYSRFSDPTTGERQFNFAAYRDAIIKRCLKEWNLTLNNNVVPVSAENIDRLPGLVVLALFQKFEDIASYNEEEVKN
jgi:hypothetical protein